MYLLLRRVGEGGAPTQLQTVEYERVSIAAPAQTRYHVGHAAAAAAAVAAFGSGLAGQQNNSNSAPSASTSPCRLAKHEEQ